ncbi:MAG: hypothetical protein VYC51_03835, partial [Pseudomonadota bacterium]|nr:hypothetical protein [Pseudomonadota bacterium]
QRIEKKLKQQAHKPTAREQQKRYTQANKPQRHAAEHRAVNPQRTHPNVAQQHKPTQPVHSKPAKPQYKQEKYERKVKRETTAHRQPSQQRQTSKQRQVKQSQRQSASHNNRQHSKQH